VKVIEVSCSRMRFGVDRVTLMYPTNIFERLWLFFFGYLLGSEPHIDGIGRRCRLVRKLDGMASHSRPH